MCTRHCTEAIYEVLWKCHQRAHSVTAGVRSADTWELRQ